MGCSFQRSLNTHSPHQSISSNPISLHAILQALWPPHQGTGVLFLERTDSFLYSVLISLISCGAHLACHLLSRWYLVPIFPPWRWRRQLTFNGVHGVASQKTTLHNHRYENLKPYNITVNYFAVLRVAKNYPCNRPWRPIGLWDVEDPTLYRQ
jgi:hypothetical protein